MTHKSRWLLLAVLPAALVFTGCESQSGISETNPDSGTPGAAHPDSATPDAATPDSAMPDPVRPDSAAPDSATPDARTADAVTPDATTPGAATPDSATPDGKPLNPDTDGPIRPVDAKADAEFVRAETSLPSPIDAGDSASGIGRALFTVNPPSVDLGVTDVGTSSLPVTVTVTNVGTATSGPLYVTISGASITVIGCSGVVLAPASTCAISIKAMPVVAGAISGTVEIGDSLANTKRIAVSGMVVEGGQFSLAPSRLDLGAVLAGKTVTGTIVLTNTSGAGLVGIVVNVTGSGYTRSPTSDCTETLAVGQSCNIDVSFTASSAGPAKGTVTVSQGGVSKIAALSATVQAPAKFVMTPASASMLTVVGTPSNPVTFYVANAGDVSSLIPTVFMTGTHRSDFSFTSTCVVPLPGGAIGSCQITVIYNPKTVPLTNASATLTVSEPGTGGSSVSAMLTGTAVTASSLVMTGTPTDLGVVVVGNQGSPSTFTLSNRGGADSGAVELATSTPQFVIATDYCTGRDLGPEQTCTFTVQFTPRTGDVGVFAGQIKATAASTANPCFLGISGSAVPPPH